MPHITETSAEQNSRIRTGRLVALACIVWWIASIGGVIFVLNTAG